MGSMKFSAALCNTVQILGWKEMNREDRFQLMITLRYLPLPPAVAFTLSASRNG